ncbi:MAG: hypothetical protein FWG39_00255 [Alphaproteobacteria bacterium]|nr:hypothetical protein [Alphaproteobacteria bacterium]
MRKLLFFLSSLTIMALSVGALYFSGRLFDASAKIDIEPYIFQSAEHSSRRLGGPVSLSAMERSNSTYVQERLIAAFVREYFGVIPYDGDLDRRAGRNSPLAAMTVGSRTPVFENWKANVKPELAALAEKMKLRRVNVHRGMPQRQGEYYVVRFDLITYNPNDMAAAPEILRDREILIRLRYEAGMRTELGGQPFDSRRALESGVPPMIVFKFVVDEVR